MLAAACMDCQDSPTTWSIITRAFSVGMRPCIVDTDRLPSCSVRMRSQIRPVFNEASWLAPRSSNCSALALGWMVLKCVSKKEYCEYEIL